MKSRPILLSMMLLFTVTLLGQGWNSMVNDEKLNKPVMIGNCDKKGLTKGEYGMYFNSQYELYDPAGKYVNKLKDKITGVEIRIVFGSWCHDSKVQVPRFMKVLSEAGYDDRDLIIIGVNTNKSALVMNIENLDIERVPTFIVYQNGEELGRIIETPSKTLEKDLWKIVRKAK